MYPATLPYVQLCRCCLCSLHHTDGICLHCAEKRIKKYPCSEVFKSKKIWNQQLTSLLILLAELGARSTHGLCILILPSPFGDILKFPITSSALGAEHTASFCLSFPISILKFSAFCTSTFHFFLPSSQSGKDEVELFSPAMCKALIISFCCGSNVKVSAGTQMALGFLFHLFPSIFCKVNLILLCHAYCNPRNVDLHGGPGVKFLHYI